MRPDQMTYQWHTPLPSSGEEERVAVRNISPVLCRAGAYWESPVLGEVLAARIPEDAWPLGKPLERIGGFSEEALVLLRRTRYHGPAVFLASSRGVGWLLRPYHMEAMTYLYAHIHCPPDAAGRVVSSGAFGDAFVVADPLVGGGSRLTLSDEPTYRVLSEAWHALSRLTRGLLAWTDPVNKRVTPDHVVCMVEDMAALAGCRAVCTGRIDGSVECAMPRLVEATMLFLLCHARRVSPLRTLNYAVNAVSHAGVDRLSLRVSFPCFLPSSRATEAAVISSQAPAEVRAETLLPGLAHIRRMTEIGGGICLCNVGKTHVFDASVAPTLRYCDLSFVFSYLLDPSRSLWGDCKHPTEIDDRGFRSKDLFFE